MSGANGDIAEILKLHHYADDDGSRVVATLELKIQPGIDAEIYDIFVEPDFRRRGIARKLLEQMFDIAKEKNIPVIFLEVAVDNFPAINLYQSFGFKEVGRRKKYYNNKVDALIMRSDVIV